MSRIERLYEQLVALESQDFYQIEADFCGVLYYGQREPRPVCVTAFLTVANWSAASIRSGVWTFYEAANPRDLSVTAEFLEQNGSEELARNFCMGIHAYQDPKYAETYDYPKEWLDEADRIDDWIAQNEPYLSEWKRNLLLNSRDVVCLLEEA